MGGGQAEHLEVLRVPEASHKGQVLEESPSMTYLEQSDLQTQKVKGGLPGTGRGKNGGSVFYGEKALERMVVMVTQ